MIRAFFKDSFIYAVPALLSRGISLLLVPLYTRVLNTADYGAFDLFMAFSSFALIIVAFEVAQGVARFYAGATDTQSKMAYASSALWFTVVCYSVFVVVMFLYAEQLSRLILGREGMLLFYHIGVLYVACNAVFSLLLNQFRWELRPLENAIASGIYSMGAAAAAVVLAYFMNLGVVGLIGGLLVGALLGVIYSLSRLRKSFYFKVDKARLREMLVFSVPLVPGGIAIVAGAYLDRVMINYMMGVDEVGLFGVGFRVASIVGLLVVGFQGALTPLIYVHHRDPETPENISRIFRYFVVLALFVCVCASLFSRDVLVLMTTESFYSAAGVVAFLAPAMLLAQMYVFAPGINIAKKTHLMVWVNLIGLLLGVVLNFIFIPLWGVKGAGLSTLLGNFFVFGAVMFFSQRYYYVPHRWWRLGLACLCAMVAVVLGELILEFNGYAHWLINIVLLFALGVAMLTLRLILPGELSFLVGLIFALFHARKKR